MTLRVKQALQAGSPAVSWRTAICERRAALRANLMNAAVFCGVFAATFVMAPLARAVDVEAVRIDGTSVFGEWVRIVDDGRIELNTAQGPQSLMFEDMAVIEFETEEVPPTGGVRVFLADGGLIRGELVREEKDAIVVRSALDDALVLPFEVLAGIQLLDATSNAVADESFRKTMADRRPGEDVFIARDSDGAKSLRGRLESLGPSGGAFVFGGQSRSFQVEKSYGIVFAAGASAPAVEPLMTTLVDGTTFSGRAYANADGAFRITASFGSELEFPAARLAQIRVRSDRVVYVSDLATAAQRTEGRLHRPWPIRHDRSLSLGTLTTGGRTFEKGLGVHSRCELDYDIGADYEKFVATVGIDDAVRPGGSVVFRVLGDERMLFETETLTGRDPPCDVIVDVENVRKLTLVVDYADELDLADHVVLGAARLLKPADRPDDARGTR